VRVSTDYDPSLSFSHYKSYVWLPWDPVGTGDTRIDHPTVHAGVRKAVEQELASKGYQELSTGTPDFYIAYHLSVRTGTGGHTTEPYRERRVREDKDRWTKDRRMDRAVPWEYEEGVLFLDVFDPKLKKLVWRGRGRRDRIRESPSLEETSKTISAAVAEILAHFPPE
jgi:hypothetical protein